MSIFPGPQPGGGGSSPVAVGDIDATGTPSASTYLRGDGSWSTPAGIAKYSTSLGSAAASISVTGLSGLAVFGGVGQIESNANSNSIRLGVNGELTSTGYTHTFTVNGVTYNGQLNDSQIVGTTMSSGAKVSVSITGVSRRYDGSNTEIDIHYHAESDAYQMIGRIQRILSGDVALSSIELWSNQANGLKANSYLNLTAG